MTCSRRVRAGLGLDLDLGSRLEHAHRAVAAAEGAAALAARAAPQQEEEAAEQRYRHDEVRDDAQEAAVLLLRRLHGERDPLGPQRLDRLGHLRL